MRQQCDRAWFRAEALDEGRAERSEESLPGLLEESGSKIPFPTHSSLPGGPPITHPHWKQESGV